MPHPFQRSLMITTYSRSVLCFLILQRMRKNAMEDTALTALFKIIRGKRPGYLVWRDARGNANATLITDKGSKRVEDFLKGPPQRQVEKECWEAQTTPNGINVYWNSSDRRPLCIIPLTFLKLQLREEQDPFASNEEGFGEVVALFPNTDDEEYETPLPKEERLQATYMIVDVQK